MCEVNFVLAINRKLSQLARPRKLDPVMNLPEGGKVTMHNSLVNASHGLNLGEKRLVSMAVAKLSRNAKSLPKRPIKIQAVNFAEQFGLDPTTAYEQLRAAQENLYNRSIRHLEYYGKNGQKVEVTKMRWITTSSYKDQEGEVALSFNPDIAPLLIQLSGYFTSYQLSKAAALRSTYSWRLYENLYRFQGTGVWEVDIEKFHITMETPKSYRRNFNDARRFVIDPAISELATKTNISAEVETIKKGRRIARLRFTFEKASQISMDI